MLRAGGENRSSLYAKQCEPLFPPTVNCPNTTHSSYRATPVGRCWMPQHPTSPVAMQAVLSSQSEPLTRSVGQIKCPQADMPRLLNEFQNTSLPTQLALLNTGRTGMKAFGYMKSLPVDVAYALHRFGLR